MTRFWLRADGSSGVGLGHLARATALGAEVTSRGLEAALVTERPQLPAALAAVVSTSDIAVALPDDAWWSGIATGDVVWFDGYHFSAGERDRARRAGAVVALVDDFGSGPSAVDLVVNPNERLRVPEGRAGTTFLFGPQYAFVRGGGEALSRTDRRETGVLLLTFGGCDPGHLGARALELFAERGGPAPFRRALLVVGPDVVAPRDRAVPGVEVLQDPPDMGTLFAVADAAITAAGSTVWELLSRGVATAVVQVTDNQAGVVRTLRETDAAVVIDDPSITEATLEEVLVELASPARRRRLASTGRALVDGKGPERVVDALLRLA